MDAFLQHLGLTAWPFSVVPRPDHCTFIAGRPTLREDIDSLLRTLSRRDTSSIHVLWSWFGAGKTHSLFYLANQAKLISAGLTPLPLTAVYTEFPKGLRSFFDLYRSFVASLDLGFVTESFLEIITSRQGDEFQQRLQARDPDLAAALRVSTMGSAQEKAVAARWLRGDALPAGDFRKIGISQKLSSTERATQVIATLILMLSDAARIQGRQGHRVIWLLDEFQRVARAGRAAVTDVNAGLHSLFNASPTGFTPVISFSGPPDAKALPDWFSPELRDRIGTTKVMVLPPFQPQEAMIFASDVLEHYRIPGFSHPSSLYPFSPDACNVVISFVKGRTELRPRAIMHAFNAVLEAADAKIETGELKIIDGEFAERVLAECIVIAESDHEEQ